MRLAHFETLSPRCPSCLMQWRKDVAGPPPAPLRLLQDGQRADDDVLAGLIRCPECAAGYPIIEGLPILLPDPARFMADHLVYGLLPQRWPNELQAWFGEAFAQSGWFPAMQRHLSVYGWDHYGGGEVAAARPEAGGGPDVGGGPDARGGSGGVLQCLAAGLAGVEALPAGAALDAGCAAGRATFALAARTEGLVLGIDINIPLLRLARQALTESAVTYPLRDIGSRFRMQTVPVSFPGRERVDFWVADVHHPPFLPASFAFLAALNLLDCLANPAQALAALREMLGDSSLAVVSLPYDWSDAATPAGASSGARDRSFAAASDAEALLRQHIAALGWHIRHEASHHPWYLRIHRRSTICYDNHVLLLAGPGRVDRG
ncbi:class I SAM-dependent methyltransferase [Chelatococcus asaccharovorans]|uniref:class I SAM-dependent methyltransferase n=1 Tax=Chelatococcus asaccharovorans TaxID=28210 RepID=UPI00224C7BC6|nr:methyltransferase domain-containing protein [Chelatococcus asaccharovorans]CAH1662004.1 Methyltransferase family protein [Chelatococcus asaccharovorans]CAH1683299.1 Methyltransferase family protein [Chelatococcus asaccharovorans]